MDSNYKELLERIITLKNLILNSEVNIEKSSELISMFILSENIVNLKKLCILDENINIRHFSKFRNSLAHLKTLKFDHEFEIYKKCIKELEKDEFEESLSKIKTKAVQRKITDTERIKIIKNIENYFMDKYGQIPEFWKLLNSPEVEGFVEEFNYIILDCEKYDERDVEEITKTSSDVVGFPVNARLLKKVENIPNEKSKNGISEFSWE